MMMQMYRDSSNLDGSSVVDTSSLHQVHENSLELSYDSSTFNSAGEPEGYTHISCKS